MTKIEELRKKLKKLRHERDQVTLEKGLLAQDNTDLRENFAYQLFEQKEHALTSRIHGIIQEVYDLSRRKS